MEQIEIEELKRRAFIHDHTAQIQLGEYYLNKKFSNSNFSRAEKFLKMAAEKHQKQGMELLISLYLKYMEYYIKNNIQPGKVSMCFRLGVK
jgi:TPR repeat protein